MDLKVSATIFRKISTGGEFIDGVKGAAVGMAIGGAIRHVMSGGTPPAGATTTQSGQGSVPQGQSGALDVVGKIWNLPNTIIGLAYGGVGHVVGWMMGTNPSISFGNNAIQFLNNPFTDGATTLGNVILYRGGQYQPGSIRSSGFTLGYEEMQHTYQGQVLGPLYLPAHVGLGAAAMFRSGKFNNSGWHSKTNVLENCPHSTSGPSPWSC